MAGTLTSRDLAKKIRGNRLRSQQFKALVFSAVLITLGVALITRQASIAMNKTDQVLECHATGVVAHHHDESCYDKQGNLVCPLPERDVHVHDDSCYEETRTLVCGLEESTGHVHDASCYAEDGTTLICGLEESEGHVHDDSCYEITRELVCGQEEVTEEHVHGPGCFVDVAVALPAQSFTHEFKDDDENVVMRVDVNAPDGAFPEGTTMTATWVDPQDEATNNIDVQEAVADALEKKEIDGKAADGKMIGQQIVDLKFFDADGEEVKPEAPLTIAFTSDLVATEDLPLVVNVDDSDEARATHGDKPVAKVLDTLEEGDLPATGDNAINFESAIDDGTLYELTVTTHEYTLEAEGDGVNITVEAPAKAGIPAGSTLQVEEIAEDSKDQRRFEKRSLKALGADTVEMAKFYDITIIDLDGNPIEPEVPVQVKISIADAPADEQPAVVHFAVDENGEAAKVPDVIPAATDEATTEFEADSFSVYGVVYTVDFWYEVDGQTFTFSINGEDSIKLSELFAALGIEIDVKHVESVTFSDPSLIEVSGPEEDADWTLTSLAPFDTEEELTIGLADGSSFTIKVTDARKPTTVASNGRIKIVKEWYNPDGTKIDPATLPDTYTSDFTLEGLEYTPTDVVRLHFIDSQGNEDSSKTVIVPTGNLRLTLYNTPGTAGKAFLFDEPPTPGHTITDPYGSIDLLTDLAIQPKSAQLDSGGDINYWVIDLDLSDYANELTDVYLGIQPAGATGGISYFTTDTYPDRTANVGADTHAMNIAYLDSGRWAGQTARNRHINNVIKGSNNVYQMPNVDLELSSAGTSTTLGKFFGYKLVESAASANGATNFTTSISWNNGVDTIYSTGLTGWSPELYITSPNPDTTIVVRNQLRDSVDVPVEKQWDYLDQDEYDNVYDWEARFVLQWAPLYEGESTPSTAFKEVEPKQYITISEADMDAGSSSLDSRSFHGLPLHGEDENGKFRYEYSVEEESYTIKSHTSGEVLATYDRHAPEGQKYTGTLPQFAPYYPHDAGELSENTSDYKVMVMNGLPHGKDNSTINITVNKAWEDASLLQDQSAWAHVKIQRYDYQTTRKIQDYSSSEMVTVKFFDSNNQLVKTERVPKGVQQRLHIIWSSRDNGSSAFSLTSSPNLVSWSDMNHNVGYGAVIDNYTDWFYPTDNMEIHIGTNSWNNTAQLAVSPANGLELTDVQTTVDAAPDTVYNGANHSFRLDAQNNWSEMVMDLPLTEYTTDGDTQTVHHYSYYFVEDSAEPSGYRSSYVRYDTVGTDHEIELGDDKYRINYDGEHVTIKNEKDTLRIRKEWRGIAKSDWKLYPKSKFTLYGTNQQQVDLTQNNIDNGTVKVIATGLELSESNNWEWKPEDSGIDLNAEGNRYDYYFVREETENMVGWDSSKYQVWMHYNQDGIGGKPDQPGKITTGPKGTLTILNALSQDNDYIQIDLKKKWMEWGTPTSWDTTTGVYKRLHDLVMGFVMYRRVWDEPPQQSWQYENASDHIISPGPLGWSDYGNEILVGYDSNGQRVLDDGGNTFEIINGDGGNWHWTIKQNNDHTNTTADQIGLPTHGWYTKPNGEKVWAYFEYIPRETGIWKNLKKDPVDDPEISWFTNAVPMQSKYQNGSHQPTEFDRDIGQDQDRLMNGQAYDMTVSKEWKGSWDAREVYVKIYRQSKNNQYKDDFTAELARDVKIGSLIGYLNKSDESMIDVDNEWIVFTPARSSLYIDKVLKTFPNTSGDNAYRYWMVEVGYKDKSGKVHLFDTGNNAIINQSAVTSNDLLKLSPTYYAWNGTEWTTQTVSTENDQAKNVGIVLGDKGSNKLKVTNNPVRDFAVIKKWKDALGKDIPNPPVDQIQVRVKQIRTSRVKISDHETDVRTYEQYVDFGGSDTLTITKANADNRATFVAATHPKNDVAQSYTKTITTDENVGEWALYLSGLEERYFDEDGNEWVCTYRVEEIEPEGPGIENFVTEVSSDGLIDRDNRNITISNVRLEGGMLKVVKTIAADSDWDTDAHFKIVTKLTPPDRQGPEGEVFGGQNGPHAGYDSLAKWIAAHIEVDEEDTILVGAPEIAVDDATKVVTISMTLAGRGSFVINDIKENVKYEVSEDLTGTTGWVQQGSVSYSNSNKTIIKHRLDTATVTNMEARDGALKITKNVTVDGRPTTNDNAHLTNGTYTFKVYKSDGTTAATKSDGTPVGDITITFEDGVASPAGGVLVDGLEAGDYVIKEVAPTNGTMLSAAARGDGDASKVSADKAVTVTVVAGDIEAAQNTAHATFTNDRPLIDAKLYKVDIKDVADDNPGASKLLTGAKFQLKKYNDPAPGGAEYQNGLDTSFGSNGVLEVTDGTTADGIFELNDLPAGYYELVETEFPAGYVKLGNDPKFQVKIEDGKLVIVPGAYAADEDNISAAGADPDNVAMITHYKSGSTDEWRIIFGNTPGKPLPNAGGAGTTAFTIAGLAIMAFGATVLLRRRRTS